MLGKLFKKRDKFAKKWTHFEEGEVECAKCDGTGNDFDSAFWWMEPSCKRCKGTGKTDWVTNVMGIKGEDYEESSCSSDWSSSISKTSITKYNVYPIRRVK